MNSNGCVKKRPWLETQEVFRNNTPPHTHTHPSTPEVSKEYSYTPYFSPLCLQGTLSGDHYLSATRNLPRETEKTHEMSGYTQNYLTPNVATVTISLVTYVCPSIRLTASLSARNEQHYYTPNGFS
jgi:hypothetical protein